MADRDVVYIVRDGDDNEMLRHSLRSLANFPHRDVWVVGHCPDWVTGVGHLPGNRGHSKEQNVHDNVRLACTIGDLGDEFVFFNDDFFVTSANPAIEMWWRMPLADHIASISAWTAWKQSLLATLTHLERRGFVDPLSYELHVPLATNRQVMAEVLADAAWSSPLYPPQWRTLYGNRIGGGRRLEDVKVKARGQWAPDSPFLSCHPSAWSAPFGDHIRAMFPDPSPYEKEPLDEDGHPWRHQVSA